LQGYADGIVNLGLAYFNGRGTAPDQAKGLKWMTKAADMNTPIAFIILADMYGKGQWGMEKNPEESKKWFDKANQAGIRKTAVNASQPGH
jgi:uncharacterized protein